MRKRMREDQSGATLLEVVIAVALFFVIGSSFVYAMKAVGNVSGTSNDKAKSSMSQSGISALFQSDIRSAKSVKLASATNLLVARTDGTCVNWNIALSNISRSTASKTPAPTPTTVVQDGIASGSSFSATGSTVSVTLRYRSGDANFVDTAPLSVATSDGGACWS